MKKHNANWIGLAAWVVIFIISFLIWNNIYIIIAEGS